MKSRSLRAGIGVLCLATFATYPLAAQTLAAPKLKGVWEPVNYSEDLDLNGVFFVTPETGYVSGAAGTILKTTDAGKTWTALLGGDPASAEEPIERLFFISPTAGWATQSASGNRRHLYRTTDGESWTVVGSVPEHHEDYAFASETEGVYVDDEQIYRTTNSGKSWSKVFECTTRAEVGGLTRQLACNLWKVHFASRTVAYAVGAVKGSAMVAFVVKSEDGGASWSVVSLLEEENGTEAGLFFIDEKNGYLSTKYAKSSFRTTDGGVTWSGMPATSLGRGIIFADPEVGWAMHFNRLSYTTEGGKRWSSRELAFPASANAFSLPRRDTGYVVGGHGMVYRYRVVPETAAVAPKALAAPVMPGLDNAVLTQVTQLDSRLEKIADAVGQAAGAQPGGAVDPALEQQVEQLQSTVDAVATGVPQLGRKHRNLNLVMVGLKLLGDLTGQSGSLKEAFAALRQARDLKSASAALTGVHSQLEAMQASVASFKSSK
jgi:photosystem II stability/assembly factor-like uncharacterized protein